MKIFKSILVLVSVFSINTSVIAASDSDKDKGQASFDSKAISSKLLSKLGLQTQSMKPSTIPGIAEVVTKQGLFYVSHDGNYILQGKLYGIKGDIVDLTETSLAQVRLTGVKQFDNNMITYPAKDEKHVITVFTDITCGYCRKLHGQMQEYNDLGITVRYLAYPRAGVRDQMGEYSQSFKDLRSIWCHEEAAEALTKAKNGSQVAPRICEQPIEGEFDFGRQIGVNGTPALILENGMLIPGYQPPEQLAQILSNL